jgi:hypothetical protein
MASQINNFNDSETPEKISKLKERVINELIKDITSYAHSKFASNDRVPFKLDFLIKVTGEPSAKSSISFDVLKHGNKELKQELDHLISYALKSGKNFSFTVSPFPVTDVWFIKKFVDVQNVNVVHSRYADSSVKPIPNYREEVKRELMLAFSKITERERMEKRVKYGGRTRKSNSSDN